MIRVLHVFGRMERAGAELRTLEVVKRVDRSQFQFDFVTLSGLPGALDEEIAGLGGRVLPCGLGLRFPRRFRQLVERGRYDVVHSHVYYFSGFILRQAAKVRVPTRIAHFRIAEYVRVAKIRQAITAHLGRRWIDRYATHILGVSEAALEESWSHSWRADPRCAVIYNGLDLDPFDVPTEAGSARVEFGVPRDATLCIHVGTLRADHAKNHERVVAIFKALCALDSSARLLLVGKGGNEVEADVRHRIASLGLEDRVTLTGVRSDVPRLLREADLLLFPSRWEGLPGAVLEACAAGTPVLGSEIAAIREVARHLGSVSTLPLSATDREWAERAREMVRAARAPGARDSIRAEFRAGPYQLERCIDAFSRLWSVPCAG